MEIVKRHRRIVNRFYRKKLLKYGLLTGLALIGIVILRYAMILPILYPVSIFNNILLLGLMFTFTYLYRKDNFGRSTAFKEIFLLNFGLGIIAAILYAAFLWLYASFIDVEFSCRFYDYQIEIYQKLGFSANELALKVESLDKECLPKNLAFRAFAEVSIVSILFALIVGIIMRIRKKEKKK